MAISAAVARGTATSNTSSTTFTLTPSGNLTAGALAVLVVSADNSASGGSSNNINSVSDTKGNTWTKRRSPLYDPGAASAGIQGAIFDSPMDKGVLTTSDTITITLGASTTAKTALLWELDSAAGTQPAYQTGGENTGSATTTPTVTTSSLTNGDAVVGGLFNEYGTAQTVTADGDATNGSWSSQQTTEIGTTTSGNTVASQVKVVTATATQTYNPTLGTSSDVILSWASYRETNNSQGITLGLLDASAALYAPTIANAAAAQDLTLGLLDASAALYAPTLLPKNTVTLPLLGGAASYAATVLADSPAAYYRLGEASGNPQDSSGNANHVTSVSGSPTYDVAGALASGDDGAARFAGGEGFNVPDHSTLDLGDTFTIEAWVKRNGGDDFQFIVSKSTTSYGLQTRFGQLALRAGGSIVGLSTNAVPATGWHHVVGVKDGAGSGNFHLYIDGVEDTDTGSYSAGTGTDSTSVLTIGADAGAGQEYWTGDIDEVAVYDGVLTAAQVEAHYLAGVDGTGGPVLFAPTLAPKATLALGLLDAGAALYAPTIANASGATQDLTLGLLDGAAALYAPSLGFTVALPQLDGAAALYAPTLTPKNTLTVPLLDGAAALYAPTLLGKNTVTLGLLDGAATLYAPTITPKNTITLGLLDGAAALYAPTLLPQPVTITLGLLDGAAELYAPTVANAGTGTQTIDLGLLDGAAALYAPTLLPTNTIVLPQLDGGAATYAPTLIRDEFLVLPLLDGGAAVYAPTLTPKNGITLGLLDGAAALYAPALAPINTVVLGLLDAGAALYAPALSAANAPQDLIVPLLDGGAAVYPPTVANASGLLVGITRDGRTRQPLGGCEVHVFRTADDVEVGQVTSNGLGVYTMLVEAGVAHYVVAYKAGSPDLAGTTVNTLVGI